MKYLVLGDIHNLDVRGCFDGSFFDGFDFLVYTGDVDTVDAIYGLIGLEDWFPDRVMVPGNHENDIYHNFFNGRKFRIAGTGVDELHDELFEDADARDYIGKLLSMKDEADGLHVGRFGIRGSDGVMYNAAAVHGAFVCGDKLAHEYVKKQPDLRAHISGEADYLLNFAEMNKYGIDVIFRGHGHKQKFGMLDQAGDFHYVEPAAGVNYPLKVHNKYIINPGALVNGGCLMLDDGEGSDELPFFRYMRV